MNYNYFISFLTIVSIFMFTGCSKDDEQDDKPETETETESGISTDKMPKNLKAIDLGLPSGTKWANMNVGASSPEDYGGYYAWGETEEKADYTWENYQYYDSSTGYLNIGSDIAGTSYDVARVKWGGSWRMPSLEQIRELLKNCTIKRTFVNGMYGLEFTGPNGGKVFLPAAGHRWDGVLYSEGSYGSYWSSTQDPSNNYSFAYDYAFSSRDAGRHASESYRYYGQSVRPVCN